MRRWNITKLSEAVREVRRAGRETQVRFAERLGVASMTVSRFESGEKEPRSPRVLYALWVLARDRGLADEQALFEAAYGQKATGARPVLETELVALREELAAMTASRNEWKNLYDRLLGQYEAILERDRRIRELEKGA